MSPRVRVPSSLAGILDAIADILHEVDGVDRDDVTEDARFHEDLNIDSLSFMEVVVLTEIQFRLTTIPDDTLAGMTTVGHLVRYVHQVRNRKVSREPAGATHH